MALQCRKIAINSTPAIEPLKEQYVFPVFKELEKEDGTMVAVKVGENKVTKEQLLQQKAAIDAMLIAIGVEDSKEVKPVEETPKGD